MAHREAGYPRDRCPPSEPPRFRTDREALATDHRPGGVDRLVWFCEDADAELRWPSDVSADRKRRVVARCHLGLEHLPWGNGGCRQDERGCKREAREQSRKPSEQARPSLRAAAQIDNAAARAPQDAGQARRSISDERSASRTCRPRTRPWRLRQGLVRQRSLSCRYDRRCSTQVPPGRTQRPES